MIHKKVEWPVTIYNILFKKKLYIRHLIVIKLSVAKILLLSLNRFLRVLIDASFIKFIRLNSDLKLINKLTVLCDHNIILIF